MRIWSQRRDVEDPGVAAARALSVTLKTHRADMHAMMLAKKAHARGTVMELLLTLLEV